MTLLASRFVAAAAMVTCLAASLELAFPATSAPASRPAADVRTQHYDLHIEGLAVEDTARLLEQLHEHLASFFGKEPDGLLRIELYTTRERWAAALKADRQPVPDASGGYYAPDTRKAYLWAQPSEYFTRQLLLHEATHQFQYLAACGNRSLPAVWFSEGLAEYFGMHNWDGKRLSVGVVPAITLEDRPAVATKHLETAQWDLDGMIAGKALKDRPEAWALVHFLANRDAETFRKLVARLNARDEAPAAWKAVYGGDAKAMAKDLKAWLASHQQPWQVVWTAWLQRGEALEGRSATNAIALLKDTPATLTAEFEAPKDNCKAGLVFGYKGENDFYLLQVDAGGNAKIVRRRNGIWSFPPSKLLKIAGPRCSLSLTQDKTSTALTVDGAQLAEMPETGRVGLNVDGGQVLFTVKATPLSPATAPRGDGSGSSNCAFVGPPTDD